MRRSPIVELYRFNVLPMTMLMNLNAHESQEWKPGQRVICDRPEQFLTGCMIESNKGGVIVINCPFANITVSGTQADLTQLGWQLDPRQAKP